MPKGPNPGAGSTVRGVAFAILVVVIARALRSNAHAAALAGGPEPLPGAVVLDRLELIEVLYRAARDALLVRAARAVEQR